MERSNDGTTRPAAPSDPALPRRSPPVPETLGRAVDHARILRAAGDPSGAARLLDRAFDAEGPGRYVHERTRFRALVLRADLALQLHDDVAAERFLAGAESLHLLGDVLSALRDDVHLAEELRERLDADD